MNCQVECSSGSCSSEGRSFFTKEERIQMLKDYKQGLDKESKGVAERIAELESD